MTSVTLVVILLAGLVLALVQGWRPMLPSIRINRGSRLRAALNPNDRQLEPSKRYSGDDLAKTLQDMFAEGRSEREIGAFLEKRRDGMAVDSVIVLMSESFKTNTPLKKYGCYIDDLWDCIARPPSEPLSQRMVLKAIYTMRDFSSHNRNEDKYAKYVRKMSNTLRSAPVLDAHHVVRGIYELNSIEEQRAPHILHLIDYLAASLTECEPIPGNEICYAVFGLMNFSADSAAVRHLLTLLTKHLAAAQDIHPQGMCFAIKGFKTMGDSSEEARRLLGMLLDKARPGIVRDVDISRAMTGMLSMRATPDFYPETKRLLAYLSDQVQKQLVFDVNQLGVAVSGLRHFPSDIAEIDQIIHSISDVPPVAMLNSAFLVILLEGLENKKSEHAGIKAYLRTITPFIKQVPFAPAADLAWGLFFMRSLNANHTETAELLEVLADVWERSRAIVSLPKVIAKALRGLEGIDASSPVGQNLFRAVLKSLRWDGSRFSGVEHLDSFAALSASSSDSPEIQSLLVMLAQWTDAAHSWRSEDLISALHCMQHCYSGVKEVDMVLQAMTKASLSIRGDVSAASLLTALKSMQHFDSNHESVSMLLSRLTKVLTVQMSQKGWAPSLVNAAAFVETFSSLAGIHTSNMQAMRFFDAVNRFVQLDLMADSVSAVMESTKVSL